MTKRTNLFMGGRYVAEQEKADAIRKHGHRAWVTTQGEIKAISVSSDGDAHEDTIAPTWESVREWLGY